MVAIAIYIVLFAEILLLSYVKFGKIVNITSIFTAIWFVFGSISCLGMFGLRRPSIIVHIYVWIFVIIINMIFWFCARTNKDDSDGHTFIESSTGSLSNVKLIQIIALVLIIPLLVKAISLYLTFGSLSAIRTTYFSGALFSSVYQDLFFRIVPSGLFNALIVYYAYYAFHTTQYKYLLYALLDAIVITFTNGGRYSLILLLYSIIIMCIEKKIKLSHNNKYLFKKIRKLAALIIIGMFVITFIRGQKILNSIVLYFSGSLSFLDYIIENPMQFGLDKKLYGYLTFGSVVEPIVLLLKVLGISSAKVPSYEFNIYGQKYYNIGDGSKIIMFNANTSILYYFLRDFGAIGVVIGAVFIGGLTVMAYNKWKKGNQFWGLVFLLMCNTMLNSLMTYQLFGPTPFLVIVVFYVCTRAKKFSRQKQLFID